MTVGILFRALGLKPGMLRTLVLSGVLGVAGALSPAAPWAVDTGDILMTVGQHHSAWQWYAWVAEMNPSDDQRRQAWRRAALLAAIELGDAARGERATRAWLASESSPRVRARAYDRLASALLRDGDVDGAASALHASWTEAPRALHAPDRLLRRAWLLADNGHLDEADSELARVGLRWPELAPRVDLERARLALTRDEVSPALHYYEAALRHGADGAVADVARLGAAVCLERLGDLDEAIVMLDTSELPEQVRAARYRSLQERAVSLP